jgi:thioredoxin 1
MLNQRHLISGILIILFAIAGCGKPEPAKNETAAVKIQTGKHTVTFIEIGSVNCIPCKMMQPVIKRIEKTYGSQVQVIFYDVWTPEGRPYGEQYGIRAIPTQIYLDSSGKEFYRHTGFAPFEDVKEILAKQGVR